MGGLLLMLLGVIAVFLLLVVGGGGLALRRIERSFSSRHLEVEFIVGTGLAPGRWTARYHRILRWMERRGVSDAIRARFEKIIARRVVRRLGRLLHYLEHASIFGDEASRRDLTNRIREIRRQWKESRFAEFAPPGIAPGPMGEEE